MSNAVEPGLRFRTGEACTITGHYAFDEYADQDDGPEPRTEEREITLVQGEVFPPISSTHRASWWKLVRQSPSNWFAQVSGSFRDDPEFGEILRLGREFRRSDAPEGDE